MGKNTHASQLLCSEQTTTGMPGQRNEACTAVGWLDTYSRFTGILSLKVLCLPAQIGYRIKTLRQELFLNSLHFTVRSKGMSHGWVQARLHARSASRPVICSIVLRGCYGRLLVRDLEPCGPAHAVSGRAGLQPRDILLGTSRRSSQGCWGCHCPLPVPSLLADQHGERLCLSGESTTLLVGMGIRLFAPHLPAGVC